MKRETLEAIIADLRAGRVPALTPAVVPAFSEATTAGDPHCIRQPRVSNAENEEGRRAPPLLATRW